MGSIRLRPSFCRFFIAADFFFGVASLRGAGCAAAVPAEAASPAGVLAVEDIVVPFTHGPPAVDLRRRGVRS